MEKVKFQVPDNEETVEFYIVEQTKINGMDYLLVAEEEEGDCDAFILKEVTTKQDGNEVQYVMVESEDELEYMSKIFASILEDVDFTL